MNTKPKFDKEEYKSWQEFVESIQTNTAVDNPLSYADREKRRKEIEADPLAWIKEIFPMYATYPFATFQKKALKRILSHPDNWYEVLSWSRELSKSTFTMFVTMYLVLTGKKKTILLSSNTVDSAVQLLSTYRANLEGNQRIAYYYGKQSGLPWTESKFKCRNGALFLAVGAGQSPRGTRNDSVRPDMLILDDFDTDSDCRNPDIINDKWNWFEQALYFTRSFSEPLTTIWCGNIIAKDCCIVRAGNKANELGAREKPLGHWDIVNIRMVNPAKPNPKDDFAYGSSVWPEKNTEEKIDEVLAQVSAASVQKECFNNPVVEGAYFKELKWGEIPPLHKFPFLISYADPATSNKVRSTRGVKKLGSYKSNVLIGICDGKLYVITCRLDHVTNDEFINWYYYMRDFVGEKTVIYNYIENNSLQDPFFEQVFRPLFQKKAIERKVIVPIVGDPRPKMDKFARIEAALEPLNRSGNLIFNIKEKDDPNMQRLEEQFLLFDDGLPAPADGPDAVEGGSYIAQQKLSTVTAGSWYVGSKPKNSKRY